MAFHPRDGRLALAGNAGVLLFNVDTGAERATILTQTDTVRYLALAPDDRTLGTVCHERGAHSVLKLWDLETRQLRRELHGHAHMIEWIAFTPDGKTFATGSWDRTVKLWDASTGQERATLQGHMDVIYHGAFSPDGKTLATAGWDGTVRLWHTATGQELITLRSTGGVLWCVAFSPDGAMLATGSGSVMLGEVTLIRASAKKDALAATELPDKGKMPE